ncbi:MAG: hypothetical protein AAF721_13510 [Myxococcota bacterium]
MGVLADFFIAAGPGVPDYDGAAGFPDSDRVEAKRITPLGARVHSILGHPMPDP